MCVAALTSDADCTVRESSDASPSTGTDRLSKDTYYVVGIKFNRKCVISLLFKLSSNHLT